MSFRAILFITGLMLSGLALTMSVPFLFEFFSTGIHNAKGFLYSIFIAGFFGMTFSLSNMPHGKIQLGTQEAFITTTLLWVIICFFASLPFYYSNLKLSFTNACFESVSALTTTGATIMVNLDTMPKGILLWRSILQWLGGVGIVVMAMTIFPVLRIGGMQLFRSEFSDRSEKILPRVSQIATAILTAYIVFTFVCMGLLNIAGMNVFDAVCHAMTAISTGGLSTKDTSIGYYNSPLIEMILCVFMFIGGSALILYVRLWNKDWSALKDSQFRVYSFYILLCVTILTLWCHFSKGDSFIPALQNSVFVVISFITSTGYVVSDYALWGSFPLAFLFFLSFSGGCTGSTTGGMKIFRFQVLWQLAKSQLHQLRRPFGVYIPLYQELKITDLLAYSVFTFMILYVISIVIIAILLSLFGVDLLSSLSTAVSCLGNIGPGVSKLLGYNAHMGSMTTGAKWIMMFAMILGRLELLTVLVLFMPSFWRD